jgi:hypothetical protein
MVTYRVHFYNIDPIYFVNDVGVKLPLYTNYHLKPN